jgi:hypothetical protein
MDALVMDLDFKVLGPASVATQPTPDLGRALHHLDSTMAPRGTLGKGLSRAPIGAV